MYDPCVEEEHGVRIALADGKAGRLAGKEHATEVLKIAGGEVGYVPAEAVEFDSLVFRA